jgi:hypothetical protein
MTECPQGQQPMALTRNQDHKVKGMQARSTAARSTDIVNQGLKVHPNDW